MYEKPSGSPSKRYGKHSVKYWVLVYVVAAIMVYGLVYWFFIRKSGSSGSTGGYHY
jgi:hypothetical protein